MNAIAAVGEETELLQFAEEAPSPACECPDHDPAQGREPCPCAARWRVSIRCTDPKCPSEHWLELLCDPCTNNAIDYYGKRRVVARPLQ